MGIFAISDLHLSGAVEKPMSIFGTHWEDHWGKIKNDWVSRVGEEDIVLIPGDISWAMTLKQAEPDLLSIGSLPGRKIMIRGNHDYWWSSISKVRSILPSSMYALQNDSIALDGFVFCGTRSWASPGTKEFSQKDIKIYNRELMRLQMSLEHSKAQGHQLIVLLHYPPFDDCGNKTPVIELLEGFKPVHILYGHLHGESCRSAKEGQMEDSNYHLVSCDYLDFKLKSII